MSTASTKTAASKKSQVKKPTPAAKKAAEIAKAKTHAKEVAARKAERDAAREEAHSVSVQEVEKATTFLKSFNGDLRKAVYTLAVAHEVLVIEAE